MEEVWQTPRISINHRYAVRDEPRGHVTIFTAEEAKLLEALPEKIHAEMTKRIDEQFTILFSK